MDEPSELFLKVDEYIKNTLLAKVLKYTPSENGFSRFWVGENDIYIYHNDRFMETIGLLN